MFVVFGLIPTSNTKAIYLNSTVCRSDGLLINLPTSFPAAVIHPSAVPLDKGNEGFGEEIVNLLIRSWTNHYKKWSEQDNADLSLRRHKATSQSHWLHSPEKVYFLRVRRHLPFPQPEEGKQQQTRRQDMSTPGYWWRQKGKTKRLQISK